jgi:hypothetical protein
MVHERGSRPWSIWEWDWLMHERVHWSMVEGHLGEMVIAHQMFHSFFVVHEVFFNIIMMFGKLIFELVESAEFRMVMVHPVFSWVVAIFVIFEFTPVDVWFFP